MHTRQSWQHRTRRRTRASRSRGRTRRTGRRHPARRRPRGTPPSGWPRLTPRAATLGQRGPPRGRPIRQTPPAAAARCPSARAQSARATPSPPTRGTTCSRTNRASGMRAGRLREGSVWWAAPLEILANLEQHVFAAATEPALRPHAAAADARLGGRCLFLRRSVWTSHSALLAISVLRTRCG